MKSVISLCLLLLCSFASADITVDSTRKSSYDYACIDVSGVLPITNHQRFDKAQAVCVERAIADPAGTYEVQGGRWRVSVDTGAAPAPTPDPIPVPDPVLDRDVVFDIDLQCVSALEDIQALAVLDIADCVISQSPYTVSVDSPDWLVSGTTIVAPVAGQGSLTVSVIFVDSSSTFAMYRLWSISP